MPLVPMYSVGDPYNYSHLDWFISQTIVPYYILYATYAYAYYKTTIMSKDIFTSESVSAYSETQQLKPVTEIRVS